MELLENELIDFLDNMYWIDISLDGIDILSIDVDNPKYIEFFDDLVNFFKQKELTNDVATREQAKIMLANILGGKNG